MTNTLKNTLITTLLTLSVSIYYGYAMYIKIIKENEFLKVQLQVQKEYSENLVKVIEVAKAQIAEQGLEYQQAVVIGNKAIIENSYSISWSTIAGVLVFCGSIAAFLYFSQSTSVNLESAQGFTDNTITALEKTVNVSTTNIVNNLTQQLSTNNKIINEVLNNNSKNIQNTLLEIKIEMLKLSELLAKGDNAINGEGLVPSETAARISTSFANYLNEETTGKFAEKIAEGLTNPTPVINNINPEHLLKALEVGKTAIDLASNLN